MLPAADVFSGAGAARFVGPFHSSDQSPDAVPMPPLFIGPVGPAGAAAGDETAVAAAAAHGRAIAASRNNHREAEKRRRERIKSHLDRLRAVLACDPKIDKASLLARAVERVRDLKQRTAGVGEAAAEQLIPTEHDEIVVVGHAGSEGPSGYGEVFEASVCCDDRSDLLPGLIETLHALRLRALRAEMATLGGRVRSVLVLAREAGERGVCGEDGNGDTDRGGFLREALRALVHRPAAADTRPKRRRVVDMHEHASSGLAS